MTVSVGTVRPAGLSLQAPEGEIETVALEAQGGVIHTIYARVKT
jgi:hypothetical protein